VELRNGTNTHARVIFSVRGDGKELFRSLLLAPSKTRALDIDTTNVKRLELVTDSGMETTHTCWQYGERSRWSAEGKIVPCGTLSALESRS
jgi:hypothetical protein